MHLPHSQKEELAKESDSHKTQVGHFCWNEKAFPTLYARSKTLFLLLSSESRSRVSILIFISRLCLTCNYGVISRRANDSPVCLLRPEGENSWFLHWIMNFRIWLRVFSTLNATSNQFKINYMSLLRDTTGKVVYHRIPIQTNRSRHNVRWLFWGCTISAGQTSPLQVQWKFFYTAVLIKSVCQIVSCLPCIVNDV